MEISIGRVTKKAYLTFFFKKKCNSLFYFFAAGCVSKKAYVA